MRAHHHTTMHLTITALVYLCLAATTTAEPIEVDWPDTSQKLNLSAPINLDYEYSQSRYFRTMTEIDVFFYYMFNRSDVGLSILPITINHTIAGGRGTIRWDPSELLDSLELDGDFLPRGRKHFFEVTRHEHDTTFGVTIRSDKYAVQADRAMDNSAYLPQPAGALHLVLLGLAVAAVAGL